MIPVPDHVPPGVAGLRFNAGSMGQYGPAGLIVAFGIISTAISKVAVSSHAPAKTEYVIVCTPGPAIVGLKAPVETFVIPAPDHVPPGSTAIRIWSDSSSQYGPAGEIVASTAGSTSKRLIQADEQFGSVIVYVIICDPGPATVGSNVPFTGSVIPVPDHVPPGFNGIMSNGGSVSQISLTTSNSATGLKLTVNHNVSVSLQFALLRL